MSTLKTEFSANQLTAEGPTKLGNASYLSKVKKDSNNFKLSKETLNVFKSQNQLIMPGGGGGSLAKMPLQHTSCREIFSINTGKGGLMNSKQKSDIWGSTKRNPATGTAPQKKSFLPEVRQPSKELHK